MTLTSIFQQDKIIMKSSPLKHQNKRVSSVILVLPSLQSQQNNILQNTQRPEFHQSLFANNLFLTNSITNKTNKQFVFSAGVKICGIGQSWILLSGKIRLTSKLGKHFEATQGFLYFQSPQLRNQIKQIQTLTTAYFRKIRYNDQIIQNLQGYYKVTRDIIFRNPYFNTWQVKSLMDLSVLSSNVKLQSQKQIYSSGQEPDYMYVLKSGEVELIRTCELTNRLFQSFQMELEQIPTFSTQKRFKMRSGNCFGIDGVFLKQGSGRVYTVITKTQSELARIPVHLLNLVYQLFDQKIENKVSKTQEKQSSYKHVNYINSPDHIGILHKDYGRKRQVVKMIKTYESQVRMKSLSQRIPKVQKPKYETPKNPFLSSVRTTMYRQLLKHPKKLDCIIPDIKNIKPYVGFLQQKISQQQQKKQYQTYKMKVQQQILRESKHQRKSKSTDCFKIKPIGIDKKQAANPQVRRI